MASPQYGVFVVSNLKGPAWGNTRFYAVPDGARAIDVALPSTCISKVVVFQFSSPGNSRRALERVLCRYVQPIHMEAPFINKRDSCTSVLFEAHRAKVHIHFKTLSGQQPLQISDITREVKKELVHDDARASSFLHNLLNSIITEDDKANPALGPLVHWMRCFSLEQPDGASPVIPGSGLPMALALDPELVAEALPRAFQVACSIAPKLRTASSAPEIALCFGLILRAFAGQYAVERKDDRSLVKGMFTLHDPWDCDDMSLMGMSVYNAMQHISPASPHLSRFPVLQQVLHYAQHDIVDVKMVHGRAETPQGQLEGHVWLLFTFVDGTQKFFEATTCSALGAAEYEYAKLPAPCDADSAMRRGLHIGLSAAGECGVIAPIEQKNYRGVQAISPTAAYIMRAQNPKTGRWKLGITPSDLRNDTVKTEFVKIDFQPNKANQLSNSLLVGYPCSLFGISAPRELKGMIELTGADITETRPKPGTIDRTPVGKGIWVLPSVGWATGRGFADTPNEHY